MHIPTEKKEFNATLTVIKYFSEIVFVRGGTKAIFELGWIGIHVPLSTKTMQRTKRNYTAINTFDKSQISGPIELFDFAAQKISFVILISYSND